MAYRHTEFINVRILLQYLSSYYSLKTSFKSYLTLIKEDHLQNLE